MAINIPYNKYKRPTIIREEIVQAICEAFLNGGIFSPYFENYYVCPKSECKEEKHFYNITKYTNKDKLIRFNTNEMSKAIDVLQDYGYYMMVKQRYTKENGYNNDYICSEKPYKPGYSKVGVFAEFID